MSKTYSQKILAQTLALAFISSVATVMAVMLSLLANWLLP